MMDESADLEEVRLSAGNEAERERYVRQFVNRFLSMEGVGVLLLDSDFRIVEVSDMIVSLCGLPRADIVSKHAELWLDEVGLKPRPFDRSLLEGRTFRSRVLNWKQDKQLHKLMIDGEILMEGKKRTGAYILFRDVSHRIVLEEQIRRSDRLKTIGQIAAGTAHEIRNPLTAIKGFMQLLNKSLRDRDMEKEQEYVGIVLSELDRVNDLVSEFLLLSRPKELRQASMKVGGVLQEILPMIRNEALLHNVTVIYLPRPELPPILADKELLKQVFLNLGKNAIEAMDGGGTLRIRECGISKETNRITVEFKDTGPGIPPDALDKVFDPFFTTKPQGTGLGLSVCQRIVDDLGGSIEVASDGDGALFIVALPCS